MTRYSLCCGKVVTSRVTIEIPDSVLKLDICLSDKVICASIICNPNSTKAALSKMLGVTRAKLYQAISNAKKEGLSISDECQVYLTQCQLYADKSHTYYTPSTVSKLVVEKEEPKTLNAKPPTKEEVQKHGAEQGAADLVDEFYATYEERGWMSNGQPIKSWKAMFRWWAKNKSAKPIQKQSSKKKMSAEDVFYEMDAETYDN